MRCSSFSPSFLSRGRRASCGARSSFRRAWARRLSTTRGEGIVCPRAGGASGAAVVAFGSGSRVGALGGGHRAPVGTGWQGLSCVGALGRGPTAATIGTAGLTT